MFKAFLNGNLSQKIILVLFLICSILYIGLEVFFNNLIFDQMTSVTTASRVEFVEAFGKTVAGIGLSLLIMKFWLFIFNRISTFIFVLITVTFLSIACSFLLQNLIIKIIVNSASDEKLGKALLISQVKNSILPFHDDSKASKKENLFWWELKQNYKGESIGFDEKEPLYAPSYAQREALYDRDQYLALAASCRQEPADYHADSDFKLAFFSYNKLGEKTFTEETYKATINKFSRCLMDDENFYKSYMKRNKFIAKLNDFYGEYNRGSNDYNAAIDGARPAKVKRIQNYYLKESRKVYGPNSFVLPNMTYSEFFKHKDVKKFIISSTKQSQITDPTSSKLQSQIKGTLPDALLATYTAYRPAIQELNEDEVKPFISDDQRTEARNAYKAIVMPMVALTLSILFLVLNCLSLISMLMFYNNPKLGKIFTALTLTLLLAIPTFKMNKQGNTFADQKNGVVSKFVMNTVYYYQVMIFKHFKLKKTAKLDLNHVINDEDVKKGSDKS